MVYVRACFALSLFPSRPPIWQLLVSRPEKWLFRGTRGNGESVKRGRALIGEGDAAQRDMFLYSYSLSVLHNL